MDGDTESLAWWTEGSATHSLMIPQWCSKKGSGYLFVFPQSCVNSFVLPQYLDELPFNYLLHCLLLYKCNYSVNEK